MFDVRIPEGFSSRKSNGLTFRLSGVFFMAGFFLFSLFNNLAEAASSPIGAKAVHVAGDVSVISIRDSREHPVTLNLEFIEGDRVLTSSSGIVEIEFDTGDLIRLDKNTDMVIRALHRNARGSTFSVFNLVVGRVKSAVSKLVDKSSRFEYHTRTAIAGVAGTPPFIVGFTGGKTFVDLLGHKGTPGAVRVQGFDPGNTMVTVFSGFRTMVSHGKPPIKPFEISEGRFRNLNRAVPFHVKPKRTKKSAVPEKKAKLKKAEDKEKKGAKKEVETQNAGAIQPSPSNAQPETGANGKKFSTGENLVINTISRKVSKPKQFSSGRSKSVEAVENQSTSGQGVIGQNTQGTKDAVSPPATVPVDIQIELK